MAIAKKKVTKKTVAKKKVAKKTVTKRKVVKNAAPVVSNIPIKTFPEKELGVWLSSRQYWNHDDWLNLLSHLIEKGFRGLVDSEEGRIAIGQFLETNRR